MKRFLILPLFLACGVLHAAEPAAEKSPTEQLLDVIHFEDLSVSSAVAGFEGFMNQLKQKGISPKAITQIKAEAEKLYIRIFSAPDFKKKVVSLYEKNFTKDEIVELTEFYRSPLGQKTLSSMPAIMKDSMEVSMPLIQKEMPAFQAKVAEIIEKNTPKPAPDEDEKPVAPPEKK